MISAELKVVGGKHAGQIIPLNRRKFLIGREQDCQLRPNSEMVSRHHCVFSVDDYSVRLRDLGSTNGTLVNGDRIRKETVLADGDRILIGNLDFQLVLRAGVTVPDSDSAILPTGVLAALDTQVTAPSVPAAPEIGSPTAVASDTTVTLPVTTPGVVAAGAPRWPGRRHTPIHQWARAHRARWQGARAARAETRRRASSVHRCARSGGVPVEVGRRWTSGHLHRERPRRTAHDARDACRHQGERF